MDLTQRKLSRSEWNSVEVIVSNNELNIINMIVKGFHNRDILENNTLSISSYLKLNNITEAINLYLYEQYFEKDINRIIKTYKFDYILKNDKKNKDKKNKKVKNGIINTADMVRLQQNTYESIETKKDYILEYIYINLITKILKYKIKNEKDKWIYYYYSLHNMFRSKIKINEQVKCFILYILNKYRSEIKVNKIIGKLNSYIEKNEYIYKYADRELYKHQKDIFELFNNNKIQENPKLILYIAPTSTGKTLTPIGLSEKYRVIFVCAARHVGINLAKSAISAKKKIAFGFGCESQDDIRLHYFAGHSFELKDDKSDYIKLRDGRKKIDNDDGTNVEIMICDIQSYIHSMNYMIRFNHNISNIITFWDEPTITLDYKEHPCHEIIKNNWYYNKIPNVILSSATLPKDNEIPKTIEGFKLKFGDNSIVHTVISHDCKKTIPLYNSSGYKVIPHKIYDNREQLMDCINYIKTNYTLMRYFDLSEISEFIIYINKHQEYINEELYIDNYFNTLDDVDVQTVKLYYIKLLEDINSEKWNDIIHYFKDKSIPTYNNGGILITKEDAVTLTDGPTIFITEYPEKIAKFYLQNSKIPSNHIENIYKCIEFNNKINKKILNLEQELEDKLASIININDDGGQKKRSKDNKLNKSNFEDKNPEIKLYKKEIEKYKSAIKSINIPEIYIPNKKAHIELYHNINEITNQPFTSNISNEDIETIMSINEVDDIWKVLLIMGIGLFSQNTNVVYTEMVKRLAESQHLYLIIANGDYIYGTNYQFCHGILSKDIINMTQEKIIQSIGRVGRNEIQKKYSIRFRDDNMIHKLFNKDTLRIEAHNMNDIFT